MRHSRILSLIPELLSHYSNGRFMCFAPRAELDAACMLLWRGVGGTGGGTGGGCQFFV